MKKPQCIYLALMDIWVSILELLQIVLYTCTCMGTDVFLLGMYSVTQQFILDVRVFLFSFSFIRVQ